MHSEWRCCRSKTSLEAAEKWKAVVGQRAQAPLSACAQAIAAAYGQRMRPQAVFRKKTNDAEIAFLPKPGKYIGDAKKLENHRVAQPHRQGLGKSISSFTCASSCTGCRPMPIWLALLEVAREMQ